MPSTQAPHNHKGAHIYIVAAERSGDDLGAKLAGALRARNQHIQLSGIGGAAMEEAGLDSPVDISPLSILGFTEGVKAYPIILQRVEETANHIIGSGAQAAVLIDSWGFMVRVAKALKKKGYAGSIIKYVAPQVWAMRQGRSKILARHVDHLLTIHAFDAPYFTRHGLGVDYVGNPVFDDDYRAGDCARLKAEFGIAADQPVLTVLFGSRLSEIQRLTGPFADTISVLKRTFPDLAVVAPVASSVAEDVFAAVSRHAGLSDVILLGEERKLDCFAAADAALACSGTVTTQLACAGVPSVVAYKLSALTFAVAKHLFKPRFISIVNIASDQELMPEFVQGNCNGSTLAAALTPYLASADTRAAASKALLEATSAMKAGNGGASSQAHTKMASSERAADAILKLLSAPSV